ncbi:hypothetical protein ZHAS_00017722 [Anopheles sinensis]|uniref:Uncharacterized protein n=1 Tax=Anopheles sinensis TaxID=74873 RepID=A0A084WH24_ANOSI|nr:hypothetical protein ZHAS_00017722 [Anopheles sinensis]
MPASLHRASKWHRVKCLILALMTNGKGSVKVDRVCKGRKMVRLAKVVDRRNQPKRHGVVPDPLMKDSMSTQAQACPLTLVHRFMEDPFDERVKGHTWTHASFTSYKSLFRRNGNMVRVCKATVKHVQSSNIRGPFVHCCTTTNRHTRPPVRYVWLVAVSNGNNVKPCFTMVCLSNVHDGTPMNIGSLPAEACGNGVKV